MDIIKIGTLEFQRSAAALDNRAEAAKIYREKSLPLDGLSYDTLEADLYTATQRDALLAVPYGESVSFYRNGALHARLFKENIARAGVDTYHLSAISAVGLLENAKHYGGIYTGQTVGEVVRDICGGVPVRVKSCFADIALYGWLPIASARDNLAQVLFAIGASLGMDLDGVLRVENQWDGVASTVIPDRLHSGGRVEYGSTVTAVSVTEHQYVPGTEEKELFKGTTQDGDLITFDAPMHDLTSAGFTILGSGANWAKLSAGTGTLTGKAYTHTTRQITAPVSSGVENVKTVKDATLVSLVNSLSVAKRLAEYYRHTETIKNPIVSGEERPGHVVSIYHPYDKTMVPACIASADTTLSAKLKSDISALVGFRPSQPDDTEYYNERVVLTGSGEISIPDNVETMAYVLIGAGQGGRCGEKGGNGTAESVSYTLTDLFGSDFTESGNGYGYGPGGAGGPGGIGGESGKVLQGTLTVTPGGKLAYSCGVGGNGAAFSPDSPADGSVGTRTVLGELSSDAGSSSLSGYADIITGEVYGGSGDTGIPGGSGAGKRDGTSPGNPGEYEQIVPASGVTDEDGHVWDGGSTSMDADGKIVSQGDTITFDGTYNSGWGSAWASVSLGSGAAAGAFGVSGGSTPGSVSAHRFTDGHIAAVAHALAGINGASAAITPKKAKLGRGGRGGYGGGGGSSIGYALTGRGNKGGDVRLYPQTAIPGVGGSGSAGGEGGDGCIILYYRKPVQQSGRGPVVTQDTKWYLDKLGRRFIV